MEVLDGGRVHSSVDNKLIQKQKHHDVQVIIH